MVRTTPASAPRFPRLLTCAALACSLAACGGGSGGDDDPAPVTGATPVGGGQLGASNPMAPVGGGAGDVPANDPGFGGTASPAAGGGPVGGPIGGSAGAPIGGTTTGVGGTTTTGTGGVGGVGSVAGVGGVPEDDGFGDDGFGGEEFEFECGGDTIVAGPGDTVSCDGVAYEVTASGEAVEVGGGGGGVGVGGVPGGGAVGGGAPGGDLATSLSNRYASDEDYDVWVCSSSGAQPDDPVGYFFAPNGNGAYFVFRGDQVGTSQFQWQVSGPDSAILAYGDQAEDITSIAFSSGTSWTGFSNTDGQLSCSAQQF